MWGEGKEKKIKVMAAKVCFHGTQQGTYACVFTGFMRFPIRSTSELQSEVNNIEGEYL